FPRSGSREGIVAQRTGKHPVSASTARRARRQSGFARKGPGGFTAGDREGWRNNYSRLRAAFRDRRRSVRAGMAGAKPGRGFSRDQDCVSEEVFVATTI